MHILFAIIFVLLGLVPTAVFSAQDGQIDKDDQYEKYEQFDSSTNSVSGVEVGSMEGKLKRVNEINDAIPDSTPVQETVTRSVSGLLVETVLGLALVIGLIFLTVYLIKKLQNAKWGQESTQTIDLEVVQTKLIGPNQRLVIARIQNEFVLLGVTNENISYLKELDKSTLDPELLAPSTSGVEFSQTVNQLLAKFKKNPESHS